jgi:hypothetical protein
MCGMSWGWRKSIKEKWENVKKRLRQMSEGESILNKLYEG